MALVSFARLVALSLLCITFAAPAVAEDWVSLGPFGTLVWDVAEDPTTPGRFYVATESGGVYRTDDGGASWARFSNGLALQSGLAGYQPVYSVTVDAVDGRVYAVAGVGLFSSDNAGVSWQELPRTPRTLSYSALQINVADNDILYVSSISDVFVSVDRGQTWSEVTGIISSYVDGFTQTADPGQFYAVAGLQPQLLRASDPLGNWESLGDLPGKRVLDLAVDATDSDLLWVSLDTGCFVSANGGASWDPLSGSIDHIIYAIVPVSSQPLLIGRGGIYSASPGTGDYAMTIPFHHTRTGGWASRADGAVLLGTDMGVFEVTPEPGDPGLSYRLTNDGMLGADVTVVTKAANSQVVYAATGVSYDAGLFRSEDGGETWVNRALGLNNPDIRSMAVHPINPDIVYVGTADALDDTGENGGVWKTTDGGLTWTDLSAALGHDPPLQKDKPRIIIALAIDPQDPEVVYASVQARFGGIYRSSDGGITWQRRAVGLQSLPNLPGTEYELHNDFADYLAMLSLVVDPTDSDRVFIGAGGCWGGTYRSTDAGLTWTRRSTGFMEADSEVDNVPADHFPVHLEMFDIQIDPLDPDHLLVIGARGQLPTGGQQYGVVFETTDGGESWSLVRETHRSDYFTSATASGRFHPTRPGTWLLASRGGVQRTQDSGGTWKWLNEGLGSGDRFLRHLSLDPDDPERIFIASAYSGVWTRRLETTPVNLVGMAGTWDASRGVVALSWQVTDAVSHRGFHVERESGDGARERLTAAPLVAPDGRYRFEDDSAPEGRQRYWLIEVSAAGELTPYGPLVVDVRPGSRVLGPMASPFPNPLRLGSGEATRLQFTVAAPQPGRLDIFGPDGRRVRALWSGTATEGLNEARWDGLTDQGRRVAPGVYYARLILADGTRTRSITVLR